MASNRHLLDLVRSLRSVPTYINSLPAAPVSQIATGAGSAAAMVELEDRQPASTDGDVREAFHVPGKFLHLLDTEALQRKQDKAEARASGLRPQRLLHIDPPKSRIHNQLGTTDHLSKSQLRSQGKTISAMETQLAELRESPQFVKLMEPELWNVTWDDIQNTLDSNRVYVQKALNGMASGWHSKSVSTRQVPIIEFRYDRGSDVLKSLNDAFARIETEMAVKRDTMKSRQRNSNSR
eukprot:jgi/Hompol1/1900/HPOL_005494-RA